MELLEALFWILAGSVPLAPLVLLLLLFVGMGDEVERR